jgi:Prenyltransferase and squalene oxidase repeat
LCLLGLTAWYVNTAQPALRPNEPTPGDAPPPTPAPTKTVAEKYDDVVQRGLDYLAGRQFEDGHWEGDDGNHPVAVTGLAGLALLMARERGFRSWSSKGSPADYGKHSANIRKAADWLMAQSRPGRDGLIFSEHASESSRYMQGHGLATTFLAGACANEADNARRKKMTEVLDRAVTYIVHAQSSQGGWHDTSKVEGHDFATIPATAIQLQALQAVQIAGIPVPQEARLYGSEYAKSSLDKGVGPADTAALLACLLGRHQFSQFGSSEKRFEECRSNLPKARDPQFGRDEMAHYWRAQAEHSVGGDSWNSYLGDLFVRLRDSQHEDGSWPAGNGISTGQVYSTAVWCVVLQVRKETHPSRQDVRFND